jgi:hypothetical protein
MVGAIEFLRKAKAICKSRDSIDGKCFYCPVISLCADALTAVDEADLVRKVMDYQINQPSKSSE